MTEARITRVDTWIDVARWHNDHGGLISAFRDLLSECPGVVVLAWRDHEFPGGGRTGLALLSASHAAIHTWPEDDVAWVDFATCGTPDGANEFVRLVDARLGRLVHDGPIMFRRSRP